MAYGLKYTGSKTHQNSDKYEVRIYQDGWTGSSYEIGSIVRLGLSLQGGMSTITAPIIKTSLFLSMIDTPDRGSTKADGTTCVEDGTKYGEWEEFYTNDPTKYKVELRYTGGLIRGSVIWTGFITPDSWGEDLMYAGPINITARDMIGTLSEYEFDLSGQVTITQIIQGAIAKSKTAMALTLLTSECLQNAGNSTSILSASVSANAFAGKNWYQVLEETLEALGLILRYNGNNGLICTSIRYAASYAIEKGLSAHTPVFVNRTGYRTLDPAVKQIVEVFNPMTEIVSAQDVEADQVLLQDGTWTEEYVPALGPTQRATVPRMQVTGNPNWTGYAGTMPNVQPMWPGAVPANSRPKHMYLPYCTTTNIGLTYHSEEILPPCKVKFTLSKNLNLNKASGSGTYYYYPGGGTNPCADIVIALIRDDDTLYLNEEGEWVENASTRTISDQTEIELPMADGASELKITFQKCHPSMTRENAFVVGGYGNYVAVGMDFESTALENSDVAGEYKTTTVYNAGNHVEINRKPVISSVTSSGYAGFLQNVLRYSGSTISDAWRWPGENSAGLPLSVLVHMQILLFNCSQNGNSVFTGTMHDTTRRVAVPGTNYVYYQRKCVLLAGEINCLSGMVESATLREFLDWSEVWGSVNPEWSQKNSSSVGGTSATSTSGTPAGTGGTTTGGGIPDAPSDGSLYGRQGGAWNKINHPLVITLIHNITDSTYAVDETEMTGEEMAVAIRDGKYAGVIVKVGTSMIPAEKVDVYNSGIIISARSTTVLTDTGVYQNVFDVILLFNGDPSVLYSDEECELPEGQSQLLTIPLLKNENHQWEIDEEAAGMTTQDMAMALGDGTYTHAQIALVDWLDGDTLYLPAEMDYAGGYSNYWTITAKLTDVGTNITQKVFVLGLDGQEEATVTVTDNEPTLGKFTVHFHWRVVDPTHISIYADESFQDVLDAYDADMTIIGKDDAGREYRMAAYRDDAFYFNSVDYVDFQLLLDIQLLKLNGDDTVEEITPYHGTPVTSLDRKPIDGVDALYQSLILAYVAYEGIKIYQYRDSTKKWQDVTPWPAAGDVPLAGRGMYNDTNIIGKLQANVGELVYEVHVTERGKTVRIETGKYNIIDFSSIEGSYSETLYFVARTSVGDKKYVTEMHVKILIGANVPNISWTGVSIWENGSAPVLEANTIVFVTYYDGIASYKIYPNNP